MKIHRVQQRYFQGPNLYQPHSGLLLTIQIDEGVDRASGWQPRGEEVERILAMLAGVFPVTVDSEYLTSPDRLVGARFPLAVLMLALAEILVRDFSVTPGLGRLVRAGKQHMLFFFPCEQDLVGIAAWDLVLEFVRMLFSPGGISAGPARRHLADSYHQVRHTARLHSPNQSGIALARAAAARNIPHYVPLKRSRVIQFGQGRWRQRTMETTTEKTSLIAKNLANNKLLTSKFLASQGLPTARTELVNSSEEAVTLARTIGVPVVIKPVSEGKGKGVAVNLSSDEQIRRAYGVASKYKNGVVVEKFIPGDDHRLLVVDGRLVAAAKRIPAGVIGDGLLTVEELVAALNRDPRRGMRFERLLEKVTLNEEAHYLLRSAGMTVNSIPPAGVRVALRRTANISTGGSAEDVTELIHPDNRRMAERVAALIGLDVTGIDFTTPDISRSWRETPCAILEVNACPGLRPHYASNPERDVAGPIIDYLFPNSDGRVPTVAITGSVGKTTTNAMVTAILTSAGQRVAQTTTVGAFIDGEQVRSGDLSGGHSAARLLQDPRVDVGVFEFARGGLLKKGMTLDQVDVGVVTNIRDNHIGIDGISSRQDLAAIKSVVVRQSRRAVVLNADDDLCLAMASLVKGPEVCLVSMVADNPAIMERVAGGGTAAWLEKSGDSEVLKLVSGGRVVLEINACAIPASWGGIFRPALQCALFSIAVAHVLKTPADVIIAALTAFDSSPALNPGRMNFFTDSPCRVMLTHPDGAHVVEELVPLLSSLECRGVRRLLITAPGNRSDDYISATAKVLAPHFDEFIVSDWVDRRGRQPGEVSGLLSRGLAQAGIEKSAVLVEPDHVRALERAFEHSRPDDFLALLTFSTELALGLIRRHDEIPTGP